ncbi:MAG: SDR family oxidoreductase [Cytophagaceae bacterium]|nr:SDR family oxidoreductase [Gemmatimonadaceae bacterium]
MDLGLTNKIALVTGASSGLGLAIARELSQEGAHVAMVARREDLLQREAATIAAATGHRVLPVAADLTHKDEIDKVVQFVEHSLGPIDILIANAGGPPSTTFDSTTDEQYLAAINLNLLSSIRLAHAVVPEMRDRKWGRVIFLSSMAAKQPVPGLILSNTARAGLLGFAKTLAAEVAKDGVLVNTVLPGHFDTDRALELAKMRSAREGKPIDQILAARAGGIPLGRSGDAREFAAVVTFLASDRASFVTGTAIQVDGGQIAGIT